LSLGGALYLHNKKNSLKRISNLSPYLGPSFHNLGPSFHNKEIEEIIKKYNLKYSIIRNIPKVAAKFISKGKVVGFFQGRAEIGQRALGNRSILANPRKINSKGLINQYLKKRDWFMPYAPSILSEDVKKYINVKYRCPYMQVAYKIDKNFNHLKSAIHEDLSSRIHCVSKKMNPIFWKLINEFKKITGIGAVLNTSFNRHGIATISSPRQAIEHLMEGCMDVLIISKFCLIAKQNRKFLDNFRTIISERENLIDLCQKRYKKVKKFLSYDEKKYYKKSLKSILNK
jgi:carbamoyltransferase